MPDHDGAVRILVEPHVIGEGPTVPEGRIVACAAVVAADQRYRVDARDDQQEKAAEDRQVGEDPGADQRQQDVQPCAKRLADVDFDCLTTIGTDPLDPTNCIETCTQIITRILYNFWIVSPHQFASGRIHGPNTIHAADEIEDAINNEVSIDRRNIPSASPLAFDLDFSALSGLAVEEGELAAARQDGTPPGWRGRRELLELGTGRKIASAVRGS